MVALIKWLVSRLAIVPWLLKTFGGLTVLLPLALLLKVIGLPIIAVLAVLAAPVLLVLFVLGLPVFAVFLVGGGLLALVFFLLSVGFMLLKVAFIVVAIVFLFKLLTGFWRRGEGGNGNDKQDIRPPDIRPSES